MQWRWQTGILKGRVRKRCLRTISFFVSYEKLKVSCLIEFYGCCGFLVLLHSSGARVNGEAGIGTNALLRKVTSLGRSVRLELGTQTRG